MTPKFIFRKENGKMTFMDFLYNIITILVIGMVVVTGACVIIMQIYREKKRDSDDAMNKLWALIEAIPDTIAKMTKKVEQEKEERKQKEEYEYWKKFNSKKTNSYRDLYPDLDGLDEEK